VQISDLLSSQLKAGEMLRVLPLAIISSRVAPQPLQHAELRRFDHLKFDLDRLGFIGVGDEGQVFCQNQRARVVRHHQT
jgi:hypothetical protein